MERAVLKSGPPCHLRAAESTKSTHAGTLFFVALCGALRFFVAGSVRPRVKGNCSFATSLLAIRKCYNCNEFNLLCNTQFSGKGSSAYANRSAYLGGARRFGQWAQSASASNSEGVR